MPKNQTEAKRNFSTHSDKSVEFKDIQSHQDPDKHI